MGQRWRQRAGVLVVFLEGLFPLQHQGLADYVHRDWHLLLWEKTSHLSLLHFRFLQHARLLV